MFLGMVPSQAACRVGQASCCVRQKMAPRARVQRSVARLCLGGRAPGACRAKLFPSVGEHVSLGVPATHLLFSWGGLSRGGGSSILRACGGVLTCALCVLCVKGLAPGALFCGMALPGGTMTTRCAAEAAWVRGVRVHTHWSQATGCTLTGHAKQGNVRSRGKGNGRAGQRRGRLQGRLDRTARPACMCRGAEVLHLLRHFAGCLSASQRTSSSESDGCQVSMPANRRTQACATDAEPWRAQVSEQEVQQATCLCVHEFTSWGTSHR